MAEAMCSGSWR